jgi:NADPH:quinone reductase-like Zn-dependent oxidoreductase
VKRVAIGSPATLDGLRWLECDPPRPRQGEILVRVRASSLNFHDYLVVAGMLPAAPGRVPLSDCAGEIVELGDDAHQFKVGDRVLGTYFTDWLEGAATEGHTARMRGDHVDGFASEFVALPEGDFTLAPSNLSFQEAAALPCAGLTAWRALVVEGGIKPGDRVLVEGSGGVSSFAIQFAKLAGAVVIATTSSDEKAVHLRALGADHVVNYVRNPRWGSEVREYAGGGVDHVVEVVGGDLSQSLQALRTCGSLYLVGSLSRQPIQFPSLLAIKGNIRISALTVGSRSHQQDMVRAIESNGLKPRMDRVFALDDLRGAFDRLVSHGHVGKIGIAV